MFTPQFLLIFLGISLLATLVGYKEGLSRLPHGNKPEVRKSYRLRSALRLVFIIIGIAYLLLQIKGLAPSVFTPTVLLIALAICLLASLADYKLSVPLQAYWDKPEVRRNYQMKLGLRLCLILFAMGYTLYSW